jgi:hypothetical protein
MGETGNWVSEFRNYRQQNRCPYLALSFVMFKLLNPNNQITIFRTRLLNCCITVQQEILKNQVYSAPLLLVVSLVK